MNFLTLKAVKFKFKVNKKSSSFNLIFHMYFFLIKLGGSLGQNLINESF